jgi:cathepsin L
MRKQGKVTPIRNQASCGSCWDFAACAAWEVSNLIRNGSSVDLSEQQILTCSGGGTCAGGWYMPVFDWMISHGVCGESACPYTHADNTASKAAWTALPSPNHAIAWGFVRPDAGIPSVADMKKAICEHGSVAVAFRATAGFQSYVGGVFNEHDPGQINHAVLLIGWDDAKQAWLMKNSWGTVWGDTCGYGTERGYCWIAYNSNSIGNHAAWVDAKRNAYIIPIDIIKQIDVHILKSTVIPKHQ